MVSWRYEVLLACCRCKYLTEGALSHKSKNKSPRTKPSSQPILTPTLLTPVLPSAGILARDPCSCLETWTIPLSLRWKVQLLQLLLPHSLISLLYIKKKKKGTPDENSFTGRARLGISFQDPSSSDFIAKAQFLFFFIPDRLNTFLFFCDTIIC